MENAEYLRALRDNKEDLNTCASSKCTHCTAEFTVDEKTHRKHRSYLTKKKEYGGSLRFDFKHRKLMEGKVDTGAYNSISMSRGGVDWHSHPSRCLNDKTCALGLPSPMDLQNITLGVLFGTVAHLVYAREGTYLVQVDSALLKKLTVSLEAVMQFFADVDKTFSDLHEEFIKRPNEPYKVYCRRWRRIARLKGFRIKLFTGHKIPRIRFKCLCDLLKSGRELTPRVTVPRELEKAAARTSH